MLIEQIEALANILIKEEHGLKKVEMLHRLLQQSCQYITIVTEHTWALHRADNQEEIMRIDKSRTSTHNALIATITAVNRWCTERGLPPIYKGENDRRQMGDFALELVNEYFKARV